MGEAHADSSKPSSEGVGCSLHCGEGEEIRSRILRAWVSYFS